MKNDCRERQLALFLISANALITVVTAFIAPAMPLFSCGTWIWSMQALHLLVFVVALTQAFAIYRGGHKRWWAIAAAINGFLFAISIGRAAWLIDHSFHVP